MPDVRSPGRPSEGGTSAFGRDLGATWNVLFFPGATFREIRSRRPLLAPWLVVSVLTMFLALGVLSISQRAVVHLMDGADAPALASDVQSSLGRMRLLSIAASPVSVLLRWGVIAAVLWAPGALLSGAVSYRGVLSIVAYSSLPGALGKGVDLAVTWFRGPEFTSDMVPVFSSATSLGALIPEVGQNPWAAAALEQLGFFTLWSVTLWVIGLRESFRWGWARSAGIAAPVWACFWLVATALDVVGRSALGPVLTG